MREQALLHVTARPVREFSGIGRQGYESWAWSFLQWESEVIEDTHEHSVEDAGAALQKRQAATAGAMH